MSVLSEFKEFASKGNVVDLAVGVVIGGAFGKIVGSFVNDVLMPPIGIILGGVDFKTISFTLKDAVMEADKVVKPAVTLGVGNFIQTVVDFLIIAFAIFMMVKAINKMKRKQVEAPAAPPPPSEEVQLLTEIRDALRK
ncbi:MAG: large-conductance mechanosensitive channel protein MscL [Ignavibacteriae bacterium]|jgi:large conductance mechanosensitive channel|nr:MAG: large-conductance mechanosensitive channel protein MscL [Ignavibacteriota bacterium]